MCNTFWNNRILKLMKIIPAIIPPHYSVYNPDIHSQPCVALWDTASKLDDSSKAWTRTFTTSHHKPIHNRLCHVNIQLFHWTRTISECSCWELCILSTPSEVTWNHSFKENVKYANIIFASSRFRSDNKNTLWVCSINQW